jgi:hypothetical protein
MRGSLLHCQTTKKVGHRNWFAPLSLIYLHPFLSPSAPSSSDLCFGHQSCWCGSLHLPLMVLDDHTADGGYATWPVENSWREREARFAEAAVVFSWRGQRKRQSIWEAEWLLHPLCAHMSVVLCLSLSWQKVRPPLCCCWPWAHDQHRRDTPLAPENSYCSSNRELVFIERS